MSKFFKSIIAIIILAFSINWFVNKKSNQDISQNKEKLTNTINSNTKSKDINSNKQSSNNKASDKPIDDGNYNILVSVNDSNSVISLNKDTKEISVKPIDDTSDEIDSNNYINLSNEDIEYLKENSDIILSEFKDGNIFDKYSLINEMLDKYDTDLSKSDLINLALKYLK